MKIVCAESVLHGAEVFGALGTTVIVPDGAISPQVVSDADALVTRSKTRVDAGLLEGAPVRFVGTATAGFDHLDVPYLEGRGITWRAAAGCNANSVAEYVTAALLTLGERRGECLAGRTVGVIGVGQVGSRVVRKMQALGATVLCNDPPREAVEQGGTWCDLATTLEAADIVTLHVPLVEDGPHPTRQLANRAFFAHMKAGSTFINASRGEVVDESALLAGMDRGAPAAVVLDVWDGEPAFSESLLSRVDLGTPHIAGYSLEGILNGTLDVYRDACEFFEQTSDVKAERFIRTGAADVLAVAGDGRDDEAVIREVVRTAYDIEDDDRLLREGAVSDEEARGGHFTGLRRGYGVRREFPYTRVARAGLTARQAEVLATLGFAVEG